MSAHAVWKLSCDGPSCVAEFFSSRTTATSTREESREFGWTRPKAERGYVLDLCPSCSADHEAKGRTP